MASGSFGTTVGAFPKVDRRRIPWGSMRVLIGIFQDVTGHDGHDVSIGSHGSSGD